MADADIVVIGGGPAGHAAALRARELGATAVVIEAAQAGGACVQHTCIPTTILLDTFEGVMRARELDIAGVVEVADDLHWNRAIARKQQLVAAMTAGIRLQFRNRDVEFVQGRARLLGPTSVHVALTDGGERTVTAGAGVILAVGGQPCPPEIPGLPASEILWADAALRLAVPPASVALLSGGGAGATFVLEIAQLFAGAGARVTLIEPGERLLPDDEPLLADALAEMLRAHGVELLTGARVADARPHEGGHTLTVRAGAAVRTVTVERVIAPDSRVPRTEGLGLETLGVRLSGGAVVVDERCATNLLGLYAAGDITGPPLYSHVAAHQGRVAAAAALGEPARVDLRILPRVITTNPELASVGLTEATAIARGYEVRTGVADLITNARALAMGPRVGRVRLVAERQVGGVGGVAALGPGAAEVVALAALAMRLEATVDDLAAVTHWHPTIAEALTEAARRALA
jgi:dihydrolipoamide dehydrogenase